LKASKLVILVIAVLIATCGIVSIYSSTYPKEGTIWELNYKRQIFWVALGLAFFLIVSLVNYRRLWDATYILYAAVIFLLILVFISGITRLGAQRWLKIIWFNFQPAELTKLIVIIFLARYFSAKSIDDVSIRAGKFGILRGLVFPFIFVAVPMGLIVEQPDLGSALIIFFIFIIMLYISGVRLRNVLTLLFIIIVLAPLFWFMLRDYQKERILVFLNPNIDPLGAGYTVIQSKIAIGSGGLFGKGWLSGTQSQLRFLPESHTDFIFATFAEEWGFLGNTVLLLLYYILIYQGIRIALRTNDYFGRLLALGISLSLCIQMAVNIGMTLGLAPVVGLPLPLMSYGGSSIIITFISLGILVNIDKSRAVF